MNSSIKKNLGFQTAYQLLSACLPLITAPYLARKLGAPQLGVFSYTSSVVAYFALFAMMGTVNYGTRSIAAVRADRCKRNIVFSSIYQFQTVTASIAIAAYTIYIVFFCEDNRLIASIQGVALLSCLFDINWLFFGVEAFQLTVTRNTAIKLATVGLIFLLVKREQDLWLYTLLMTGGTLVSNLILFAFFTKYVSIERVDFEQVKNNIAPNLVLFIPLLAMSVYHTMDKTMLGILSTYEQSGYYYNSDKVVQIPLLVINGFGTVMLPRMTSLLNENNQKEAKELFLTTLEGTIAVSIAVACGIAGISKEFVPLFFGAGYDPCVMITIVFTPVLLVKGLSVIVRTQFLIPMKMEKCFTKSVVGGAIVNLILNLVLIPRLGALGAAIATVVAETVACFMQLSSISGLNLNLKKLCSKTAIYTLIGFLMILVVRLAARLSIHSIVKLFIEIMVGALFYCTFCYCYWVKTQNAFYSILIKPVENKIKH